MIGIPYTPADAASAVYPNYYAGITRPDPVVVGVDYNDKPPAKSTTLTFTATACNGCIIWLATDYESFIKFTGIGSAMVYSQSDVSYIAPSGTIHIVVETTADGPFTQYADVTSVPFVENGTTALGIVGLTAVPSNTALAYTSTIPSDYTYSGAGIGLTTAPGKFVAQASSPTLTGTFSVPVIPGETILASGSATGPNGEYSGVSSYVPNTTTTAAFQIFAAPSLLTPTQNATGVSNSDTLTWSAYGTPAITVIGLSTPTQEISIYSASTSLNIGQLGKAQMGLQSGAAYTWQATVISGAASMDAYVVPAAPPPNGTIVPYATSAMQGFTTP